MEQFLKRKLLLVPVFVWILQLLYVAFALGLFAILRAALGRPATRLSFQITYVAVMVVINIIWRVTLKKAKPEWF